MDNRILSVFLVDDEKIIRDGMKKLFTWETNGFRVIGEAGDGRSALAQILEKRPDIVVTDLKMPFMDGIALANAVVQHCPVTEVVVVTGFDEFSYAREALRAGVFDFLLKPVSPDELKKAMLRVKEKIQNRSINYPFEQEAVLVKAIAQGQAGAALDALASVFDGFIEKRVQRETAWNISARLLDMIETAYKNSMGPYTVVEKPELAAEGAVEDMKTTLVNYVLCIFGSGSSDSSDLLVEKIKRHLEDHYQENITLKALEDAFYFNASYISRIFKNKTGENYSDFLLRIRIDHAKKLLVNTNRSIRQISEMVGFGNSKYFSRIFKDIVCLQPIAYRNAHRYGQHE